MIEDIYGFVISYEISFIFYYLDYKNVRKEILDSCFNESESKNYWIQKFDELNSRGIKITLSIWYVIQSSIYQLKITRYSHKNRVLSLEAGNA